LATPTEATPVEAAGDSVDEVEIETIVAEAATPSVDTVELVAAESSEDKAEAAHVEIQPAKDLFGDINKALETSGLVMVETSGDKIRFAPVEASANEIAPRSPRRRRPAPSATASEPLVMVETQQR
jgi:ribonuclease E